MATKYPLVFVHGVMLKDIWRIKAFGKIEGILKKQGYSVFTSDHDGFGSIENNAEQIKAYIEKTLAATGAERVNIVAHSKGGLDTLYMIDRLGMGDKIASVTFLSTPHRGSSVAVMLYDLPRIIRGPVVFFINFWYRIFGDKKPDALTVCRQLRASKEDIVKLENLAAHDGIYMQSFSTTLKRGRDDFVMGIPLMISKHYENIPGDGMVSVESSKYGEYRGDCTDISVSHSEIVGFMVKRKKKDKIYGFYISLAEELGQMGF